MLPDSRVYTDFAGLTTLRARAQANPGETLGEVAEQFEAVFLQMMLKSMRATTHGDPLLGEGGKLYAELFDQQIALDLAGSKRFGLAQSLVQSIRAQIPSLVQEVSPSQPSAILNLPIPPLMRLEPAGTTKVTPAASVPHPGRLADTPEEFVEVLWPHAQHAGQSLGVDPRLLIAQAALETGWGRSVIHDGGGAQLATICLASKRIRAGAVPTWRYPPSSSMMA